MVYQCIFNLDSPSSKHVSTTDLICGILSQYRSSIFLYLISWLNTKHSSIEHPVSTVDHEGLSARAVKPGQEIYSCIFIYYYFFFFYKTFTSRNIRVGIKLPLVRLCFCTDEYTLHKKRESNEKNDQKRLCCLKQTVPSMPL